MDNAEERGDDGRLGAAKPSDAGASSEQPHPPEAGETATPKTQAPGDNDQIVLRNENPPAEPAGAQPPLTPSPLPVSRPKDLESESNELHEDEMAMPEIPLEPRKALAMECLMRGLTVGEAAARVGVSRMTLYRWMDHDKYLRAAVATWEILLRRGAKMRLRALAEKAVATLDRSLNADDGKAAMQLLKALGYFDGLS